MHYFWKAVPLENKTGSQIFEQLFLKDTMGVLLESPYPTLADHPYLCRYSICAGNPYNNQVFTPSLGQILPTLDTLLNSVIPDQSIPDHLPFIGGWLGWLGYDTAWEIEKLPYTKPDLLPFPVAYWYQPENFAVLDHQDQVLYLFVTEEKQFDRLLSRLHNVNYSLDNIEVYSPSSLTLITDKISYQKAVIRAKKYIERGDIFQGNLSLRFHSKTNLDSWTIYRRLHEINPSPFASYWKTKWGDMISCSPERLVHLNHNIAQSRPIAGTRPRGKTPQEDQQLAEELLSNTKEKAEHIMLVDLERNDLGKICKWGTVAVDELLTIERYSHVMHLVSNIKGIVHNNYNSIDVIRSMFPGGTITGCPKVRCMEIIEELEPVRRNLFYGSCGYLDTRGHLDLNILIRTLLYENNTVWGQVGAGIVADSDPEKEWFESLNKAKAQLSALGLLSAE